MWPWILFVLLLIWHLYYQRYSAKRRLHLINYIVYLLLNDQIRSDHKAKLVDWIKESSVTNVRDLGLQAWDTLENMAEKLGDAGSILAANAMMWKVKEQS